MVDSVRGALADTLAPAQCRLCAMPAPGRLLCAGCERDLPWNSRCCPVCAQPQLHDAPCAQCLAHRPAFDYAWSPLRLEGPVRNGLLALKYGARFVQAQLFAQLMAQSLLQRAAPWPLLILPVPLHRSRLMWRGYNQAVEIARRVSQLTGIACDARALRKTRRTRDQIGLTPAQRHANVRGAFSCTRNLDGLHIALFDDVMTTGATLNELARVCRKAGAAKVEAWSAARTPAPD